MCRQWECLTKLSKTANFALQQNKYFTILKISLRQQNWGKKINKSHIVHTAFDQKDID